MARLRWCVARQSVRATIRVWHDNPFYGSHTVTREWFEGAVLGQVAAVLEIADRTLLEDL